MKKIIAILLCLCLFLCSCGKNEAVEEKKEEDFAGMYFSYTELLGMALSGDFKESFTLAADNCKELNVTDMFIHVRAMSDSIYPSAYYPLTDWAKDQNFDALAFMIEACHKRNMRFHAWINPYRISSSLSDLEKISPESPAHSLSHCIGDTEKGLYFDPSYQEVKRLILDSIREIINRYDVDGIHFDDYFYPTDSPFFDLLSYNGYCSQTVKPLSLDNFRRANVNSLISGVKTVLLNADRPVLFSISPAANIENNENHLYADVDYWCRSGFIDAVMPQLYFGFDYPNDHNKFENLLNGWIEYLSGSDVILYPVLAPYKLDTDQNPDSIEWENGTDIIARQIKIIKENPFTNGFALFSYSYVFGEGENYTKQKENIKKEVKEEKK
ncbi:MAG: hypothetical protein E7565_08565 [Ruminococcaceae bacterium]|nr:hypothetical protein [Oscillospiraceae bacterium]